MKKILLIFLIFGFFIFTYLYFLKKSFPLNLSFSSLKPQQKIINLFSKKDEFKPVFLEIISPSQKAIISYSPVVIKGKTIANAEVFVNEKEIKADENGNFSVEYPLEEGENEIIIVVNDQFGNYQEKIITIQFESQKY